MTINTPITYDIKKMLSALQEEGVSGTKIGNEIGWNDKTRCSNALTGKLYSIDFNVLEKLYKLYHTKIERQSVTLIDYDFMLRLKEHIKLAPLPRLADKLRELEVKKETLESKHKDNQNEILKKNELKLLAIKEKIKCIKLPQESFTQQTCDPVRFPFYMGFRSETMALRTDHDYFNELLMPCRTLMKEILKVYETYMEENNRELFLSKENEEAAEFLNKYKCEVLDALTRISVKTELYRDWFRAHIEKVDQSILLTLIKKEINNLPEKNSLLFDSLLFVILNTVISPSQISKNRQEEINTDDLERVIKAEMSKLIQSELNYHDSLAKPLKDCVKLNQLEGLTSKKEFPIDYKLAVWCKIKHKLSRFIRFTPSGKKFIKKTMNLPTARPSERGNIAEVKSLIDLIEDPKLLSDINLYIASKIIDSYTRYEIKIDKSDSYSSERVKEICKELLHDLEQNIIDRNLVQTNYDWMVTPSQKSLEK